MLIIRRATTPEAKALKSFDAFIGERRLDNWRGELFVCEVDGAVIGFVSYNSNSFFNRPFICAIAIHESHQRKGVATALVQAVLRQYEGLDVWTSTEDWNEAALALFTKQGFVAQGAIAGLNDNGVGEVMLKRSAG